MTEGVGAAPHLLYVAWGYPPARTGGVHRALATANRFAEMGWRVTVLTADLGFWETHTGADASLLELIDPRIAVVRVPFSWPAKDPDLSTWPLWRVLAPRLWWRWRVWSDRRDFPEAAYGPWGAPLAEAARSVHAADPVGLVVATVNPYVDAVAGLTLHSEHDVPFVVDYRDAWSLDMFSGATLHTADSPIGRVEQDWFQRAREIWFVNEPIRAWHAARHPGAADRMHVVPNGIDSIATFSPRLLQSSDPAHAEVVFGYLGTLTYRVPLSVLLAGWRLAREEGLVGDGDRLDLRGYLGYYRAADERIAAQIAAAGDVGVSYGGPVAKADVGGFYAGCHVLLLAMGSGRYVTSGKTYEYAATGLPVVGVYDNETEARATLAGYPLLDQVEALTEREVAVALGRGRARALALTEDQVAAARTWSRRLLRTACLDPRIESLSDEVSQ